MKIAINCAFFQPKGGGIREYILNLVQNLVKIDSKNEYVAYVLSDMVDYAKMYFPFGLRIKKIPYTSQQVIKRSLFESSFWRREERDEQFDIFHSPFFHAPRLKKAKVIITVHDLRFCRFPSTYTFKRLLFLKYAVAHSVRSCDKIISISSFTKDELIHFYKLPENKVVTVLEAINLEEFSVKSLAALSDSDKKIADKLCNKMFLFSLGHIEPRKNYIRLSQAFKKLLKEVDSEVYLVIAGKRAQGFKQFASEIQGEKRIIYLDFVSRDLLLWLYSHASAFVFPSIYEGFGFPPLEAAALGTISAVSNSSCIPEICGDSALYFNPCNVEDIKNACKQILFNQEIRSELKEKSKKNLQRFSWKKNAENTLKVYNEVYNNSSNE